MVTYVDAINSGAVPCLENAVTTLAQIKNSAAVQKAANHYSEQMAQRVSFPTDTLQELLDLHADCAREAIAIFMKNSFKDENQEFLKHLMVLCLSIYLPCLILSTYVSNLLLRFSMGNYVFQIPYSMLDKGIY